MSRVEDARRSSSKSDIEEQYRLIGNTLLVLEASSLRVGIPLLPPTEWVRRRRTRLTECVEDEIHYRLLSVQTAVLESYGEDLESLRQGEGDYARLYLVDPSRWERLFFSACLALLVFGSTLLCLLFLQANTVTMSLLSLSGASVALMIGSCLSSEATRLGSFHWLLLSEVERRRGNRNPNLTKIPVYSTKAEV